MESTQRVAAFRLLGGRIIFIGQSAEDALERKKTLKLAVKDRVKNTESIFGENAEGKVVVKPVRTQDTMSNTDILELIASLAPLYLDKVPDWFSTVEFTVSKEKARMFASSLVGKASLGLPEEFFEQWNKTVPGREFSVFQEKVVEAVGHIMDYYDERYNEIRDFDKSKGPRRKTEVVEEVGEF